MHSTTLHDAFCVSGTWILWKSATENAYRTLDSRAGSDVSRLEQRVPYFPGYFGGCFCSDIYSWSALPLTLFFLNSCMEELLDFKWCSNYASMELNLSCGNRNLYSKCSGNFHILQVLWFNQPWRKSWDCKKSNMWMLDMHNLKTDMIRTEVGTQQNTGFEVATAFLVQWDFSIRQRKSNKAFFLSSKRQKKINAVSGISKKVKNFEIRFHWHERSDRLMLRKSLELGKAKITVSGTRNSSISPFVDVLFGNGLRNLDVIWNTSLVVPRRWIHIVNWNQRQLKPWQMCKNATMFNHQAKTESAHFFQGTDFIFIQRWAGQILVLLFRKEEAKEKAKASGPQDKWLVSC